MRFRATLFVCLLLVFFPGGAELFAEESAQQTIAASPITSTVLPAWLKGRRGDAVWLKSAGEKPRALVDISIEPRRNFAFAGGNPWQAFNIRTGMLLAGMPTAVPAKAGAYLATLTFASTADAAGVFEIGIQTAEDDITTLFPAAHDQRLERLRSATA